MKTWVLIPLLLAASAISFVIPDSWRPTLASLGAILLVGYLGMKIGQCHDRISDLEEKVSDQETTIDMLRKRLSLINKI